MKQYRLQLHIELALAYGLDKHLSIFTPRDATFEELTLFHTPEYIRFLKQITPETVQQYPNQVAAFCLGEDCPVFPDLYGYIVKAAGGSIAAAAMINSQLSDISINYMGGLHHAKSSEASGFCYVNDIVLCILELLKTKQRVLYIDIDIHHGDGVEEAFYCTPRVFTLSFHKYAQNFFPGTGNITDIGYGFGKNYCFNVPLKDFIDDEMFLRVFKAVSDEIIQKYQPETIVLQCGADSLAGDRLGIFNLTLAGHGGAVQYIKEKYGHIPLILLGGGGYTLRNVARCWTYETALACGQELNEEIPANNFYSYFGPDYRLSVQRCNGVNVNTDAEIDEIIRKCHEQMKNLESINISESEVKVPLVKIENESLQKDNYVRQCYNQPNQLQGEGISEGQEQKIKEEIRKQQADEAKEIAKEYKDAPLDWEE